MGVLVDRVGRQNMRQSRVMFSALSVLALWYDAPRARFLAFSVFYGAYAGGYNALLPTTITDVFGVQNYAAVNGVIYFIRGIGMLFGAPVAGAILGSHSRSASMLGSSMNLRKRYHEVVWFDGILLIGATFCVAYLRWPDARNEGRWVWKA
ncbi:hypothetical protein PAXINDRAFT_116785 [Paxillus involutus ATCC 200175]|uniref:Major facilitator superfamily (MFS) profile domain-containing protein n=1 Tax=Paxillus involutus ATCC 200175 TaxID=664439 RepID=A0A0C9SWC0_PAXIN|nr:hypothetical protein PAXINDRAFT_116785 [Paxillus involutus ATCC 200175]